MRRGILVNQKKRRVKKKNRGTGAVKVVRNLEKEVKYKGRVLQRKGPTMKVNFLTGGQIQKTAEWRTKGKMGGGKRKEVSL